MWQALYKKEMAGFFYGYSVYAVMAVYALLSLLAAFFFGMYLTAGNSGMLSYFAFQPQVLTVIIPAVSMRLWAEENKSGTIEVLFTMPFSSFVLASAKFVAGWTIAALLTLFFLPLAISSALFVPLDWGQVWSAWTGTWLAAGALLSVGCVSSFLASSPAVAYLSAVALCWLLVSFNPDGVWRFFAGERAFESYDLVASLGFSAHYENFISGIPSVADIVYFAALISFFLGLNIMLTEYKRSK